jgi:hypothetical protein
VVARPRLSLIGKFVCAGILATFVSANAQTTEPAAAKSNPSSSSTNIADDWNNLVKDAVPQEQAKTAPSQPAASPVSNAGDFLNHFYFETRTEYTHGLYEFSGQPTATGVVDSPAGINGYPDGFQDVTNTMYSYVNLGTHGLGSDRINTNFSMRYRQDLSNILPGSPGLSVLNTFGGSHIFEIMSGYLEINGKPSDGWFANSTLRLGRQSVFGPYMSTFDGATFSRSDRHYDLTLYGGRRFTYFGDPVQRGIGGVDFTVHLNDKISVGYHGLYYVNGTHGFSYRQRILDNLLLNGYFRMVGGHPVDFNASTFWSSSNGRTTLGAGFFQKITDKDYIYDYTVGATDKDPYNKYLRLYFGPKSPYSQFTLDARHTFNRYLRAGGTIVVRKLNNNRDQSDFDTSFQDYRGSVQVFPGGGIETFVDYHLYDPDRKNPSTVTDFLDVSATGETRIQDLTIEVGRGFLENKVNIRGGGFIRRINYQGNYYKISDTQDKGWVATAAFRPDSRTRVYFDYSLDTDFFVWRPSIKNGQVFRIGLDWKF